MAKIKIFHLIRKNFATAGISPELVSQTFPINWKIFMGFSSLMVGIYAVCVYIFNDAKTFVEYTQSIYICSMAILIFAALTITLLNVKKLFNFIEFYDRIAKTGEIDWNQILTNCTFENILWIFRSIKIFCIEIHLWWNQSNGRKIERNHISCNN